MRVIDPKRLRGQVVAGRYRLDEPIGSGSYGQVFAATELLGGDEISRVAVKVFRPDDSSHRSIILGELRSLAELRHPNVISYLGTGQIDDGVLEGCLFLATELANGSLATVDRGAASEIIDTLIRGLSAALAFLHERGVVHRDVKPANVLRVGDVWKLADFGVARALGSATSVETGHVVGAFPFMSPEHLRGHVGPASDVYAFGVTVMVAMTGEYPYVADTAPELIGKILDEAEVPAIPEDMLEPYRSLVVRCLSMDMDDRPTASEIAASPDEWFLRTLREVPPTERMPVTPQSHPDTAPVGASDLGVAKDAPSSVVAAESAAPKLERDTDPGPWWPLAVFGLVAAVAVFVKTIESLSGRITDYDTSDLVTKVGPAAMLASGVILFGYLGLAQGLSDIRANPESPARYYAGWTMGFLAFTGCVMWGWWLLSNL